MKSKLTLAGAGAAAGVLAAVGFVGSGVGAAAAPTPTAATRPPSVLRPRDYPAATTPVAFWSTEARCAIVPAGPGGVFGAENFGNKFPGDAAVYMGIVHVAMYDAAVSINGGYKPYAATPVAPAGTSPEAAVAAAAYDTLTGLQPQLGASQTILDADYAAYLGAIPDGTAKADGIAVGEQAAQAVRGATRERRPRVHAPPSPTSASPPRGPASGNPGLARCSDSACQGCDRSVSGAPASSGPTVPAH